MKRKRVFSITAMICIVATMALPVSLGAAYEYKVGDECEFKCENVVPHETCKGEASVDGRKIRVTCDGKETLCPEGGITVL